MGKRILIVDDEAVAREMLAIRLKHGGYDVDFASNGREALGAFLESLYNEAFDLIILDIMMPHLDGKSVLDIIRKEEDARGVRYGDGVPIIMLTAARKNWFDAFNRGCDDYVLKPYDSEVMLKKIKEKIKN